MKLLVLALALIGSVGLPANASGWQDYELEIAPGFSVYRMNSFEVCLGSSEGQLLVCPSGFPDVGPIVGYAVTAESILTRHEGVRPHPKNPTVPDGDPSKEFFFIVSRDTRAVTGPFDRGTLVSRSSALVDQIRWVAPHNPNFWRPLLGDLIFLSFTLLLFGWPIGVLVFLFLLGWWWLRRRRRAAA